ncbi:MAG: DUF3375 family protein [Spirochaetales bacterium]|nr:DUF3375 family protein [Spirochaetales bacterium]
MDAERLRRSLTDNPSLRLLRNPHVLFLLLFFRKMFYEDPIPMVESDLLEGRLASFFEECGLEADEIPLAQGDRHRRAKLLLDHWCRDEIRYLRRFADENGQVWVEATPWTQRVFQWIETLDDTLVGTESRFDEILQRLDDLVLKLDPDPQSRIRRLEKKKAALDLEIQKLKNGLEPPQWTDVQLEERVSALNRLSRALLGDFKQVEQNFQALVRRIYEQQAQEGFSRGDILGYTLDAAEELRQSPQGRSFYAFWEHLIREGEQESLPERLGELFALLDAQNRSPHDEVLRHLKTHLHLAGRKVIAGNRLLAEKLNKLLSEQDIHHHERLRTLLASLKEEFARHHASPPADFIWEVEGDAELSMVADRPWSEPPEGRWKDRRPQRESQTLPAESRAVLTGQFSIDLLKLRRRVAESTRQGHATLDEILTRWPPEQGLSEVLAYLEIASFSPTGHVNPDETTFLPVDEHFRLRSPRVEFGHV